MRSVRRELESPAILRKLGVVFDQPAVIVDEDDGILALPELRNERISGALGHLNGVLLVESGLRRRLLGDGGVEVEGAILETDHCESVLLEGGHNFR